MKLNDEETTAHEILLHGLYFYTVSGTKEQCTVKIQISVETG